eukprot:scaffold9242_cov74-Phaeocystis_antarctica.AAC.1
MNLRRKLLSLSEAALWRSTHSSETAPVGVGTAVMSGAGSYSEVRPSVGVAHLVSARSRQEDQRARSTHRSRDVRYNVHHGPQPPLQPPHRAVGRQLGMRGGGAGGAPAAASRLHTRG